MTVQVWLHSLNKNHPTRQRQSVLARRLLNIACQFNDLKLSNEELRMPGLQLMDVFRSEHGLSLSLSHCRQMVVVALAREPLGVDCEPTGRQRNWQGIADCFFSASEADSIRNTSTEGREELFLKHWVLKESHIKAIRGSIFGDLNRLLLETDGSETRLSIPGGIDSPWWAWQGQFAACFLGIRGSGAKVPALKFFESQGLMRGDFARCDNFVTGSYLAAN